MKNKLDKEGLVYLLQRKNWMMEHCWVRNDWGDLVDYFQMTKINKDGFRIHYPFLPLTKARNYDKDTPIKNYFNYTRKEYHQMFLENKKKLSIYEKIHNTTRRTMRPLRQILAQRHPQRN